MFNPFHSQLALAGVGPALPDSPTAKPGVAAMLANVRGRMVGRGAPPVSVPATPPHVPAVPLATPATLLNGSATPLNGSVTPPDDSAGLLNGPAAPPEALAEALDDADLLDALGAMAGAITQMQGCMEAVRADIAGIKNRNSESERLFNTLHAEMLEYKRDFVFEHVKPVLRPMLFVFDALEEFDREMSLYQDSQAAQTLAPDALRADKVRENIAFVREQFEQALLTCDVELLPTPEGKFNAQSQKGIATVPVAAELDGVVQKVTRPGWTLKGRILRPTEVIVGKALKTEGHTP